MTFPPAVVKTPIDIGNVVIILKDGEVEGAPFQTAHFHLDVKYNDGSTAHRRGDLAPHLTPAQISALQDFMSDMRIKAEEELLPGG
ncbi:MAG: hypothetical protein KKB38_20710 [Gammaproteobacteria bacterium]|nr:hypothetical protein [Gammaproteobacteria bacterium]